MIERGTIFCDNNMAEVKIIGFGEGIPKRCVSNDALTTLVDTNDEWIRSRTGIQQRYIATDETLTDLCTQAAQNALRQAGITAEQLDLVIVATLTPDLALPNASCMLQKSIGAVNAACFDLSAACSGFMYALNTARMYIKGGAAKYALVVGGEILSKIIDWTDRSTCVLFGDGAGAAVVAKSDEPGILDIVLGTDGAKGEALMLEERPSDNPFRRQYIEENGAIETNLPSAGSFVSMNGQEVFKFAVKRVPECIFKILENTGYSVEDIDYYVLHQANLRILSCVAKKIGVSYDKFYVNLDKYGNTSAASVPIALAEMSKKGMLKKGMKVIMVGFGGGLTWGGGLVII